MGAWLKAAGAAQKVARREIQASAGNGNLTIPIAVAILILVLGMAFNAMSPGHQVAQRTFVPATTPRAAPMVRVLGPSRPIQVSQTYSVGSPMSVMRVLPGPSPVRTSARSVALQPHAVVRFFDARLENVRLENVQSLKIKIGDTNDAVRAVYGDGADDHWGALGIWIFFNAEQKVRTIRIDVDFSAIGVDGIGRGAAFGDCVSAWGQPYKRFSDTADDTANLFHRQDGSSVRADISDAGRVRTLLLTK